MSLPCLKHINGSPYLLGQYLNPTGLTLPQGERLAPLHLKDFILKFIGQEMSQVSYFLPFISKEALQLGKSPVGPWDWANGPCFKDGIGKSHHIHF